MLLMSNSTNENGLIWCVRRGCFDGYDVPSMRNKNPSSSGGGGGGVGIGVVVGRVGGAGSGEGGRGTSRGADDGRGIGGVSSKVEEKRQHDKKILTKGQTVSSSRSSSEATTMKVDYAALHDEFLSWLIEPDEDVPPNLEARNSMTMPSHLEEDEKEEVEEDEVRDAPHHCSECDDEGCRKENDNDTAGACDCGSDDDDVIMINHYNLAKNPSSPAPDAATKVCHNILLDGKHQDHHHQRCHHQRQRATVTRTRSTQEHNRRRHVWGGRDYTDVIRYYRNRGLEKRKLVEVSNTATSSVGESGGEVHAEDGRDDEEDDDHEHDNIGSCSCGSDRTVINTPPPPPSPPPLPPPQPQRRHPSTYMHPRCQMQKDKGKGEQVGAKVCAEGRRACLKKLNEKLEILSNQLKKRTNTNVDGQRCCRHHHYCNQPAISVRRMDAKVSKWDHKYVETRSLIEVRMGFLAVQYGVLLRWDCGNCYGNCLAGRNQVTFIVLRKMCHESFYPAKSMVCTHKRVSDTTGKAEAECAVCHSTTVLQEADVVGENVILHRSEDAEVTLREATTACAASPLSVIDRMIRRTQSPKMPRGDLEDVRPRSTVSPQQSGRVSISVLYAVGLNRRSSWTLQLAWHDAKDIIETVMLAYDPTQGCFKPKQLQQQHSQQRGSGNGGNKNKSNNNNNPINIAGDGKNSKRRNCNSSEAGGCSFGSSSTLSSVLEIKVFENRGIARRLHHRRHLFTKVDVPLKQTLRAVPSKRDVQDNVTTRSRSIRVRIPVPYDDNETAIYLALNTSSTSTKTAKMTC